MFGWFRTVCVAWLAVLWFTAGSAELARAQTTPQDTSLVSASPLKVSLGLGGAWKLGHVCPVRVSIPSQEMDGRSLEIVSVDGDGVEVVYRQSLADDLQIQSEMWFPVRIGGQIEQLKVRLTGTGQALETTLDPSADAKRYSSAQPLILAIGSPMGVEELASTSASGERTFATVVIDQAEQLPTHHRDLEACDLIVISTSNLDLLRDLSSAQWTAIAGWIRRGGGCVISLTGAGEELRSIQPLLDLLPGEPTGVGQVNNPAALESLMSTDEPLSGFPITLLELTAAEYDVQLSLTDSLSRRAPWWITYPVGHGTVRLITSDLDHPSLSQWKDRRALWERLIEPYFSKETLSGLTTDNAVSTSSYLGYDDMVGQLRATLDVFSKVRVVSFGQVAAMLVGVLLLIGPLDYLISVKWLKPPRIELDSGHPDASRYQLRSRHSVCQYSSQRGARQHGTPGRC
ncbi:MAG: hypothetical protein R3C53_13975 [Pirellulaceae bacterium]